MYGFTSTALLLTWLVSLTSHCFLAQGGVNHQEISEVLKKLDTSHTFERRDDLVGANVNVSIQQTLFSNDTLSNQVFVV